MGRWSYDQNGDTPDPNLSNFSLGPYGDTMVSWLQRMRAVEASVTLFGSVWSPPQWMKQNNNLRWELVDSWVSYFTKYLEAFQEGNVKVDAITLQNEPLHSADTAWTMHMDQSYQAILATRLASALDTAKLDTEIWAYDHNTDKPEYPQYVLDHANVSSQRLTSVAWHCYASGSYDERWSPLSAFHTRNPSVKQYMSECWTHLDSKERFFDLPTFVTGPLQNYANGALAWSLGGSTAYDVGYPGDGACKQCSGLVQVDMKAGLYDLTQDYYTMGQYSKFVQRGAQYLNTTGNHDYRDGTGVQAASFKNPDGSRVVVIQNKIHNVLNLQVKFSSDVWEAVVPARSVITWIIE